MRVLFQTCRPLISTSVAPPGAMLTAGVSGEGGQLLNARRPLVGGERQRGEHDHFLGGLRWARRCGKVTQLRQASGVCSARAPLRRHHRLAHLATASSFRRTGPQRARRVCRPARCRPPPGGRCGRSVVRSGLCPGRRSRPGSSANPRLPVRMLPSSVNASALRLLGCARIPASLWVS